MPFHKVIGIDLGTTYSAVSIWDGKDVVVIDSRIGTRTIPSVVGLDPDRQVIVGVPAQNSALLDPDNTIIEVKRQMGVYERAPSGPGDAGVPLRIPFRGREHLPQEISAFILMELKRQAEEYVGGPIHDAVITVPAYFREPQRRATEEAGQLARLNVRRLLNEPTAAAVCFGTDKAEDDRTRTYAVYDLGGGTFDVSIIQVRAGNVSVVGTGGDSHLGGGDFDDRIVRYALDEIKRLHGVDLSQDRKVCRRIKREAEARKRELSSATSTMLDLPYLTATVSANIPLSRATFESLIDDLLKRSLTCLDEAIRSAQVSNGIELDDIEQVLLVGGSTRIARIRPMLAEALDLDPGDIRSDINPDEVVARGAGMVARDYEPSGEYLGTVRETSLHEEAPRQAPAEPAEGGRVLQDVTGHSLGIMVNDGEFAPILPRDSRIPAEVTQDNFTNGSAFTKVDVLIFQGEQRAAYDNELIGTLPIELPEARERGYWKFAVTFGLDPDGLLKVKVRCLNDDTIWKTDLHCSLGMTTDEIDRKAGLLSQAMGLPRPPAPQPAEPEPELLTPPPENTPVEFRTVARRSFKLIDQLAAEPAARLRAAYQAFVTAVRADSDDVEALGDELHDVFYEVK